MEAELAQHGLTLEDAMSVVDALTLDDIDQALDNPAGILDKLLESSFPIAKKAALFHSRPDLEPVAESHGLDWQDITIACDALTLDLIRSFPTEAPENLIRILLAASFPVARKSALFHLRPVMEPKLQPHGIPWHAVEGAIESFTLEDLERGASDPDSLVDKMIDAALPIAKITALFHARSVLEPHVQSIGLEWSDLSAIVEEIELSDLEEAATGNVDALISNLLLNSVPLAIKSALFLLKPRLLPLLESRGISWIQATSVEFTLVELEAGDLDVILAKIVAEHSAASNRRVMIARKPNGKRVWQQSSRHGLTTRRRLMQKVYQAETGLGADHRRFFKKLKKAATKSGSAIKKVATAGVKSAEKIGGKIVDQVSKATGVDVKGIFKEVADAVSDPMKQYEEALRKFKEAKKDAQKGFAALKSLSGQDLVDGCMTLQKKIESAAVFDLSAVGLGKVRMADEFEKQFGSLGCQQLLDEIKKMQQLMEDAAAELEKAAEDFGDHLSEAWDQIQQGLTVTAEAWAKILVAPTLRCASKRSKLGIGTNLVIGLDVNAFGMQKSLTLQVRSVSIFFIIMLHLHFSRDIHFHFLFFSH